MSTPASDLQDSERLWAGKAKLLRLLDDLASSGLCRHTFYIRPESLRPPTGRPRAPGGASGADIAADLAAVIRDAGDSDTGLAIFSCDDQVLAVVPPFPIGKDTSSEGADTSQLVGLLSRNLLVGVLLLRLGRYAVGVLRGEELLASKSGSRYVKSRHRAGGSSQRRFERSRERLIRELFDAACRTAKEIFSPFDGRIDFFLTGGERHTLKRFSRRCTYLEGFGSVTLRRTVEVERPGRQALERMPYEVWKSRVLVFPRSRGA